MEGNFCENSLPLFSFHQAVQDDNMEEVKRFLSAKSCDSEEFGFKGQEYLVIEDEACSVANCKRTVKSRAPLVEDTICSDVNIRSPWRGRRRRTAIFYVRSLEMAEFLVSQGAVVKIQDKRGYTPLHFAHNPDIANFFLDQGLDIEAQTHDGNTPLYEAIVDNRIETARFLFERGANPYADTGFKTPWSEAKSRSKWHTFSLNRLIKDFDSYTPPKTNPSETSPNTDSSDISPTDDLSDIAKEETTGDN